LANATPISWLPCVWHVLAEGGYRKILMVANELVDGSPHIPQLHRLPVELSYLAEGKKGFTLLKRCHSLSIRPAARQFDNEGAQTGRLQTP
jgi:hypothetical protein